MRQIVVAVMLAALVGVVGCSSKPKPTVVDASIETARDANPDRNGRPSPVVIYLYELESSQEFGSADFFALTDAGSGGAPGVLQRHEYQLDPGDRMRFNEEVSPDARYLGSWRPIAISSRRGGDTRHLCWKRQSTNWKYR